MCRALNLGFCDKNPVCYLSHILSNVMESKTVTDMVHFQLQYFYVNFLTY